MEQGAFSDILEGRHNQRMVHKRILITECVEMEMQEGGLDGKRPHTEQIQTTSTLLESKRHL